MNISHSPFTASHRIEWFVSLTQYLNYVILSLVLLFLKFWDFLLIAVNGSELIAIAVRLDIYEEFNI